MQQLFKLFNSCVCVYRAGVSMTPQSEAETDKSGRSTAATAPATGTAGHSSRAGRDTKSYAALLLISTPDSRSVILIRVVSTP